MTTLFSHAIAIAIVAAGLAWLAISGYVRARSDPLHGLEVHDLALVRGRKEILRSGGPLGLLGRRLARPLADALGPTRLARINRRIELAGRPDGMTVQTFLERKARLLVIFGLGALVLAVRGKPIAVVVAVAAWILPDLTLRSASKARQARIDSDLPDFLDVLAVTVSAGLSFRAALARVASRYRGPLADEMVHTLRELDVGVSRRAAFQNLRERNDSEVLEQFVVALLQAEELGSPLTEALDQIAREMRRSSAQRARQKASKTSPRVALVVTMVMVPGALVLLVVSVFLSSDVDLGMLSGG